MKRILYILALVLSILACTDDIDKSNRFTFTGETMADYLLNRSEKYSHFIKLLKRAELFSLLQTYGQYTLFLPDNDAVEKFVAEQDNIYWATKDTDIPVWTGITSPLVEELSNSMANVIARNHLIETMHMMAEMGEGALPSRNFLYRFLGVNYAVEGEQYYIKLNNSTAIIGGDHKVENGVVHLVDKVVSPSQKNVPELIGSYNFFGIFSEALYATGFCDSLTREYDNNYMSDKYTLNLENYGYATFRAPETKYYKYTGFVETDEVFHSYGIHTLDDLRAFAEKWYGTEERDNPRSPHNALYKFVAYHFVPREMPHNSIVPYGIYYHEGKDYLDQIMPAIYDRYDYFETMQGTMMKAMKPLSRPEGRDTYINFNKREVPFNTDLHRHLNVRVIPLTEFIKLKKEYAHFDQMASNGIVHPIDKILIYNEDEMHGNILNERIRIDVLNLMPELQCNGVRYRPEERPVTSECMIPDEYSEKLSIKSGMVVVPNNCLMLTLFGDYLWCYGLFDFELTLPPLPSRVYEVRVGLIKTGYAIGNGNIRPDPVQVYIDGKVEGLPFPNNYTDYKDHESLNVEQTGYVADQYTLDNGFENDKQMRNIGWMKAPVSFVDRDGHTARDYRGCMRKIITRKFFAPGRHTIRFRYIGESAHLNTSFDYLEFVPLNIVNDPLKPEDRH